MAALTRGYLVEDIVVAITLFPLALPRGKPRSRILRSDDDGTLGVALPLGGIVFGEVAGRRSQEVKRCTSTALATASFGGMAQQGLGDVRMMMDSRWMVDLSGFVVRPMAGLAR